MSIQHKFKVVNWGNGFVTKNAILSTLPYKPECMIVGTFNPDDRCNHADFFYGRNFFWPAIKNLYFHNNVVLTNRRMPPRGIPPAILDPTLVEIFEFCKKLKLSFSDLILEVLHLGNPEYIPLPNCNVNYLSQEYNLVQDKRRGNVNGLEELEVHGQVHWNTRNIIKYLCDNPQIKAIYFTRRPTGIWRVQWNLIRDHACMKGRYITNIFTPSGAGRPVNHSMKRLLDHWVNNSDEKFGRIGIECLKKNGVDLSKFILKLKKL